MKHVKSPNLPQGRVIKALLSAQADNEILRSLESRGVEIIQVQPCSSLAPPVASHPDLLFHQMGEDLIAVGQPDEETAKMLSALGFTIIRTERQLGAEYPADVALDAARIGCRLICNPKFIDNVLLEYCKNNGIHLIPVKQGYAKCSVSVVDQSSIITSDAGIAATAISSGISVLRITEDYIRLPGLRHGFIGGCCGKIAPDMMAFSGDLLTHPDHDKITDYLSARGVKTISLCNGPLTDIGGIIPLAEE
jgi:hypothetical protein